MHIFFSVGEPSGDQHAAHLIRELRRRVPDAAFSGFGGPEMERSGCSLLYRLTDLAVMFITSVIPHLRTFYRLVQEADRRFRHDPPDAVVLIDYPGFNWHIARKAKAAGIPVFYFLPPQLWAWGPWRVRKMRKFVDHVLCGLPFEPDWYAKKGITAEYVGHPFFDEITEHELDREFCDTLRAGAPKLLGVLPGSRHKEIERNWRTMLRVLDRVHRQYPDVRFAVASYNERQRARCEVLLLESGLNLPLEFHVGKTAEVIEAADCCFMVSGSVSLEMLARAKPACVIYALNTIARLAKGIFLQVEFITLPNLFAKKTVMPEWILTGNPQREVEEISDTLTGWLTDDMLRASRIADLQQLRDTVMRTGATQNTAAAILRQLLPASTASEHRAA